MRTGRAWILALLPISFAAAGEPAPAALPPGYDPITYPLIDGFTAPELISCEGAGPVFTQTERAGARGGFVAVRFQVGVDGRVRDVEPEGPWVKPALLRGATRWLGTCTYRPGRFWNDAVVVPLSGAFGFAAPRTPDPDEPAPIEGSGIEKPPGLMAPRGDACGPGSFDYLPGPGLVTFTVHRDGHVTDIDAGGIDLSPEALKVLNTWLSNCPFKPARKAGRPVPVRWRLRESPFSDAEALAVPDEHENLLLLVQGRGLKTRAAWLCSNGVVARRAAAQMGITGRVTYQFAVAADGSVDGIWRLNDAPPVLYQSVRDWLTSCGFKPALDRKGRPVASSWVRSVNFVAPAKPGTPSAEDARWETETFRLRNGLAVVLNPDQRQTLVAVGTAFRHGMLHETPGRVGLLAAAATLLLRRAERVPRLRYVADASQGSGGVCNSDFDGTYCDQTVAPSQLRAALEIERDRLAGTKEELAPDAWEALRASSIDMVNQRRSVPYWATYMESYRLLFAPPHPLHEHGEEAASNLGRARASGVRELVQNRFGPGNASLAIAGAFDTAAARALVKELFDPLPARPTTPDPVYAPPSIGGLVRKTMVGPSRTNARLDLIWQVAGKSRPDGLLAEVLAELLSAGPSSVLGRSLIKERRSASSAEGYFNPHLASAGGWLRVVLIAAEGHAAAELLPPVDEALTRLRTTGPTLEEVERAVGVVDGRYAKQTWLTGSPNRASVLNAHQLGLDDPSSKPWEPPSRRAITPENVRALANEWLSGDRRIELITEPQASPGR